MYTLFIGFRKIDVFPTIREAKKFATESELIGVFTLIGDNYHDSWYKFQSEKNMKPLSKNEVSISQARQKKCCYYKKIVKRHLNDIKESIKSSKNNMEEDIYKGRYAVQLSVYARALNVQEKYLERFI